MEAFRLSGAVGVIEYAITQGFLTQKVYENGKTNLRANFKKISRA
jgi:hypothetical protein